MGNQHDPQRLARLGRVIKARRVSLRRAVAPLAKEVGMSPATWRRIEVGHDAEDLTYGRIEQALDFEPGSILEYLEADGPEPGAKDPDTGESIPSVYAIPLADGRVLYWPSHGKPAPQGEDLATLVAEIEAAISRSRPVS